MHGFTGNPSSLRPMGEHLSQEGFTVLGPRLKGHGTSVEDMAACSYSDWLASAETSLQEMLKQCNSVFVAGLSMGATIALHLAYRHPDVVKGVVSVCGSVHFKGIKFALVPLVRPFMKTIPGVGNDIKDPSVTESAYDEVPIPALHELLKLCRMVREELPAIKQPVLVIAAKEDHVVHPSNPRMIFEQLASTEKELLWLENSYHVATLDYDKELIFNKTAQFMRRFA